MCAAIGLGPVPGAERRSQALVPAARRRVDAGSAGRQRPAGRDGLWRRPQRSTCSSTRTPSGRARSATGAIPKRPSPFPRSAACSMEGHPAEAQALADRDDDQHSSGPPGLRDSRRSLAGFRRWAGCHRLPARVGPRHRYRVGAVHRRRRPLCARGFCLRAVPALHRRAADRRQTGQHFVPARR